MLGNSTQRLTANQLTAALTVFTYCLAAFTGLDVLTAAGLSDNDDFAAHSFRQLQPVLPQRPVDVQADITFFMNDVSGHMNAPCLLGGLPMGH